MTNNVMLIGRLVNECKIEEQDDKKTTTITLAVNRTFKNEDGVYETDFINCILFNGIAENITKNCHKGDLIAIKGRLQTNDNKLEIIAEKVTFLSIAKKEESEN